MDRTRRWPGGPFNVIAAIRWPGSPFNHVIAAIKWPGLPSKVIAAVLTSALVAGCGGAAAEATRTPSTAAKPTLAVSSLPTPTRASLASPVPKPKASPAASPAATAAAKPSAGPGETYEVSAGDTLATIAERFYNDRSLWNVIYDANKEVIGANPDAIQIGMKLRIPPKP